MDLRESHFSALSSLLQYSGPVLYFNSLVISYRLLHLCQSLKGSKILSVLSATTKICDHFKYSSLYHESYKKTDRKAIV